MEKLEAIKQMEAGVKITHRYFDPEEWMTMQDGELVLEDGVKCNPKEFWNHRNSIEWADGYSIWTPKPPSLPPLPE